MQKGGQMSDSYLEAIEEQWCCARRTSIPTPANAPAGSSRSSYGGDEIAEAFGMRVTNR